MKINLEQLEEMQVELFKKQCDLDIQKAMVKHFIKKEKAKQLTLTDVVVTFCRCKEKTKAYIDQKIRSLSGFNRYWFEVLQSGELKGDNQCLILVWSEASFISTHDMMRGWKDYERGQKQYAPRQERDFHSALKRLCPSASKDRHVASGNQKRGYQLPSLPDARTDFTKAMGEEVQWDD